MPLWLKLGLNWKVNYLSNSNVVACPYLHCTNAMWPFYHNAMVAMEYCALD